MDERGDLIAEERGRPGTVAGTHDLEHSLQVLVHLCSSLINKPTLFAIVEVVGPLELLREAKRKDCERSSGLRVRGGG